MKILIVTGIFPPDIGGPATYVPQIATGLVERGHSVTVVTLSNHAAPDPQNPKPNTEHPTPNTQHRIPNQYPFRVVRILRKTWKPWRWAYTMSTIIRLGRDADVLFINGLAMEVVIANFVLRKPLVQKVVGDLVWELARNRGWVKEGFEDFQKKRYGPKVETLKALRGWWTRQADTVIVPSRYLATWVAGWGVPQDRIVVIYNAIEPFNGIQPAEVPLQTPIKLVTVGRLVAWKCVDQILGAVANMRDVGLIIVGDGPERVNLEDKVKELGITDRVHFAGARSKGETLALMAGCDVFVLNSTYEGFPHVVLEAMSVDLPVVAKSSGGTPEVVMDGRNGLLIEPLAEGALFESLSGLLGSPSDRLRLVEGAKETVARFVAESMVEETESILQSMAE